MVRKLPTVSVFIPAHNEEKYVGACIDSLLNQSVPPLEIVVINNASTDKTAEVVKKYRTVRLINQPKLGILPTRTKGFNSCKGDIIARVDADCRVDTDWVERIRNNFVDHPRIAAVTGPFYYYDMPASWMGKAVESTIRGEVNRFSHQARFLAGANMGIRREVWQAVSKQLCDDETIHEDLDIAIHLHDQHYVIRFDPEMSVGTSARRLHSGIKSFYRYMQAYEHTYNSHGIHSAVLKVPILIYFPLYPVLKLIQAVYDEKTHRINIKRLLEQKPKKAAEDMPKDVVRHHHS